MPLHLLPFPRYAHLPMGQSVDQLPLTREGIHQLPPETFTTTGAAGFAELTMRRHQTGIVCRGLCGLLPWQAFRDGTVRPHENTLVARLNSQKAIVLPDHGALGKPILLTVPSLKEWWAKADRQHAASPKSLVMQGQDNYYSLRHYTANEGTDNAPLGLDGLGPLVIADGHHRAETHAKLGEQGTPGFDFLPVCLIGADELHIGVFARIVTAPDTDGMMDRLQRHFTIEPIDQPFAPRTVGEWLLTHQGRYFRLHRTVRQGDVTDVEWLNTIVLPDAFGITDVRTDERIAFEPVNDPVSGLIEDVFPADAISLIGFPLPKERFFAEVSAGRVLPPKSTRFEPRVPSGLVVWEGS